MSGRLWVVGLVLGLGAFASFGSVLADEQRLALASEQTGLIARTAPDSPGCEFSTAFELYLCPPRQQRAALDPDRVDRSVSLRAMREGGVLLIPNSTDKLIMTFDPMTGAQIDDAFIVLDDDATGTAIHALLGPAGTILVSDQTRNVVHQYGLSGQYMGVFAPAGGADTTIMQNIRGMAIRPGGNLLVTVGAGDNADTVAEFDSTGQHVGNFIAAASGGLDSPFDIHLRSSGAWLVSSIDSNELLAYNGVGSPLGQFAEVSNFPQQILELGNGNILLGNFSGNDTGVLEFQSSGALIDRYNPPGLSGFRGVYELGNGNILTSTSGGVHEINRTGALLNTHHVGQSRFIQYALLTPALELQYTVGPFVDQDTCPTETNLAVTPGTSVAFCYRVQNNGSLTWNLHDLEDSEWGVVLNGFPFSLTPGNHAFLVQEHIVTEDISSVATWTAYNPGPVDQAAASASISITVSDVLFSDRFEGP
jgi:hypothetical protein